MRTRRIGRETPVDDRERAWSALLEATPAGWYVGTPVYHVEREQWVLYGYDTTERVKIGKRNREWTAVAPTEERVVSEMARCLTEIAAGRVPA